jgi:hypothetical protein
MQRRRSGTTQHSGGWPTTLGIPLAAFLLSFATVAPALAQTPCLTPLVENEPLCSPAVADSSWPISHRGPYAQGSAAEPGPVAGQTVTAQHVDLTGTPITLAVGPAYPDGGHAVWGALLGLNGGIVKIDADTFSLVDTYIPADEEAMPPTIPLGVTGAYSVADPSFHFVLGRADFVEIYGDSVPGDRFSPIALVKRVFLPSSFFCRSTDLLVGGTMLPDGNLAIVTKQAAVGVIPSDAVGMDAANLVALPSENGAACTDPLVADDDLETVSNSIAADENGGIYVVTNAAVIKYQWDGTSLTKVWRTEYLSDPPFSVLRLGPGSGSTPSLMGTALDDDRFVVITDGQELMHLVLMWRDEIPSDWVGLPGRDPRIACEIPVTFGDPTATRSLSEQSVLVRGYGAVVVSNLLSDESAIQTPLDVLKPALAALEGGNPDVAPAGAERFDWDPLTRTCASTWTNPTISLPNAIPTMSATTGLMYALGQRGGVWGLEGLDFDTGASVFTVPSAQTTCSQTVLDQLAASVLGPFLSPVVERLPASCENSLFAATEVGPDGAIYQGTFLGASRFVPDSVPVPSARAAATAGARQGLDLVSRGVAATGASDVERARDAAERGQTQLDAAAGAVADAEAAGELDATSAAGAGAALSGARAHFAVAEGLVDSDLSGAGAALSSAVADLDLALDCLVPCPPMPQAACRTETKGTLRVLEPGGSKNRMTWTWKSGAGIDPGTLPDPTRHADYALCLYDAGGRIAEIVVPADRAKWRVRRAADGLLYRDPDATAAGASKVRIRESPAKAKADVKGKGAHLPAIPLPVTAPLTVQLVNGETGLCWQTTFDASDLRRNGAGELRALSRP